MADSFSDRREDKKMREIKFRAWYKPLGKMIEPNRLEHINFEVKVIGVYIDMDDRGFHKLRMSDFELMQYTGLKDRYGKEIYEGDICRDSLGWVFVVKWDAECARFIGTHSKPRGDTYICYIDRTPLVEIIGNICENPKLLTA